MSHRSLRRASSIMPDGWTFKRVTIQRANGNIEISAPNRTDKNIYIKEVKVNGKTCTDGIITYDDLKNGATIRYELTK